MFTTIINILSGALNLFNKFADYMTKKDMENSIKNGYEKDKALDALEEDKAAKEQVEKANQETSKAKEAIKNIAKSDKNDADLTDDDIVKILMEIQDPEEREQRSSQIKAAKEIKAKADAKQKEIESDEKFNSGEEISFKG